MKAIYFFRSILYKVTKKIVFYFYLINKKEFSVDNFNRKYSSFLGKFRLYHKTKFFDHKIIYPVKSDIGLLLYLNGSFENEELNLCRNYINEKSVIFDIGANIGTHSLFFSSLAPKGKVYSFEPSLKTYYNLLKNIYSQPNIFPFNIALSGSNGINEFYESIDSAYSSLKDTKRKEVLSITNVICFKADYLFGDLGLEKIDFIKIDVEGFEYEVLKGMSNIMQKYKPVIMCEIYKGVNSNENPEITINYLKNLDYDVRVIKDGKTVDFVEHDDNFYNYLFLPKKSVK